MNNDNYPMGAQYDPVAPYNQKTERKKVLVSVIYSREVEVELPEGADISAETENIRNSVTLPLDLLKSLCTSQGINHSLIEVNTWSEDNFSVVES